MTDTTPAPTPQVEAEPQNALTKTFTEQEWTAVKALRTALPLIFEEALTGDDDARLKSVDIWGVQVDPGRVDDARVSVVLRKFVKAVDFDEQKAIERLTATVKWRKEFDIQKVLTESFDENVYGGVGFMYGKDKEGRPITYNVYGGGEKVQAIFADLDTFIRWRVQLQEKAMRQLDFETVDSLVQVHDYNGVGMSSRTEAMKKAAAEATRVFGEYYPETLHVKFFVNVPFIMNWVFWLMKTVIPAKTFSKLHMIGQGPQVIGKEMLKYVDASELPAEYGGTAAGFKPAPII